MYSSVLKMIWIYLWYSRLRTMENGFPTQHILPFSEIVLSPDDITTSSDGSVATTIEFKAPVYCEGGQGICYCFSIKLNQV